MKTRFTISAGTWKHNMLLLLACLLLNCFQAAVCQTVDQMRKPVPPGCVQVNDTLFMDETEVQNNIWLNYLFYLKRDSIELDHDPFAMALPDTANWLKEFGGNIGQQFARFYHNSVETDNHPVVNITYNQAVAFCRWRSAMDTQLFNYQYKKSDKDLAMYKQVWVEFHYRLPTEEEWEAACISNNPKTGVYGFGETTGELPNARALIKALDTNVKVKALKKDLVDYYSQYPHLLSANVKPDIAPYFITKRKLPRFTENVYYYPPNQLGLYGMIGNVAEMVEPEGTTKGGSWADPLSKCHFDNSGYCSGPSTRVGFRSACTVKILEKEPKNKFWMPNP